MSHNSLNVFTYSGLFGRLYSTRVGFFWSPVKTNFQMTSFSVFPILDLNSFKNAWAL
nr:hypothetical protein [Mycoplasmopsis bovis]